METLLKEIIQKIETDKKDRNRSPSHATLNEIRHELLSRMEIELGLMVHDRKVKVHDTIHCKSYSLL